MAPEAETTRAPQNQSLEGIWDLIPPEERVELISEAQAKGIEATLLFLLMTFSAALGLKTPWIFLGSLLLAPFAFQIISIKAWRLLKPRPILEYFTAKTTARAYADSVGGRSLEPALMLRGELQPAIEDGTAGESAEDDSLRPAPKPVWISLFPDTLVVVAEGRNGAILELGHSLLRNFSISAEGFDDGDEGGTKRLKLEVERHPGEISRWYLTSRYPAALLACERRASAYIGRHERQLQIEAERRAAREREQQPRLGQARPRSAELGFSAAR